MSRVGSSSLRQQPVALAVAQACVAGVEQPRRDVVGPSDGRVVVARRARTGKSDVSLQCISVLVPQFMLGNLAGRGAGIG